MAFFGLKKNTKPEEGAAKKPTPKKKLAVLPVKEKEKKPVLVSSVAAGGTGTSFGTILLRPRVTEKATMLAEKSNCHVFEVPLNTTKGEVMRAIRELYRVTPKKIALIDLKRKRVVSRGRRGVSRGGRKAYVYLNAGDKIETI